MDADREVTPAVYLNLLDALDDRLDHRALGRVALRQHAQRVEPPQPGEGEEVDLRAAAERV